LQKPRACPEGGLGALCGMPPALISKSELSAVGPDNDGLARGGSTAHAPAAVVVGRRRRRAHDDERVHHPNNPDHGPGGALHGVIGPARQFHAGEQRAMAEGSVHFCGQHRRYDASALCHSANGAKWRCLLGHVQQFDRIMWLLVATDRVQDAAACTTGCRRTPGTLTFGDQWCVISR